MSMGGRLVEVHDYIEQTGCDLEDAVEKLGWFETEIKRKEFKRAEGLPAQKANPTDETLPF